MKFKSVSSLLLLFLSLNAMAMPAQILIIRHGEKPTQGSELSKKGYKRAKALVTYFKTNPNVTQFGTPVAIYAMKPKDSTGSVRAIQTVTPLANALGLQVQATFLRDDLKPLVDKISSTPAYDGKMVLICWEHTVIPDLAQDFGVSPKPADWDDSDFSTVFEIDFDGKTVSKFKTYPEDLRGLLI